MGGAACGLENARSASIGPFASGTISFFKSLQTGLVSSSGLSGLSGQLPQPVQDKEGHREHTQKLLRAPAPMPNISGTSPVYPRRVPSVWWFWRSWRYALVSKVAMPERPWGSVDQSERWFLAIPF